MSVGQPFIIHALGRSRTAWLSAFLSYGKWTCFHEIALAMRSMDDFRGFFSRNWTGTAETGASLAWPLIQHARPGIKTVVVKRDVDEAIDAMRWSYRKAGIGLDDEKLESIFRRSDKSLDKISTLPNTLTVSYEDLATEDGCRKVFEFCLDREFDIAWWREIRDQHIEADLLAVIGYYWANREGVENFKRICKRELIRLARSGEVSHAIH